MPGPRNQQRRAAEQWESLSAAQRKRYVSAGRTGTLSGRKGLTQTQVRNYYLSGKSLTAARRGRASKEVTAQQAKAAGVELNNAAVTAAQAGDLTDQLSDDLKAWRKSNGYPDWLPKSDAIMGDDTAAILASIGSPPSRWESVVLEVMPDGSVNMTVQRKGRNQYGKAKPITVRLPDIDSAQEVGRLLQSMRQPGLQVTMERNDSYKSPGPRGQVAA